MSNRAPLSSLGDSRGGKNEASQIVTTTNCRCVGLRCNNIVYHMGINDHPFGRKICYDISSRDIRNIALCNRDKSESL